MTDSDYSAILDKFDRHVREHFAYLEIGYGFKAGPLRTHDLNEPRDSAVTIRYNGDAVSVQIAISPVGQGISVLFKNEKWLVAADRWVSLDDIVALRTNGATKSLLHELTSSRNKYWLEGFLLENMDLAIQTLAARAKHFADDLIRGDVSNFKHGAANGGG